MIKITIGSALPVNKKNISINNLKETKISQNINKHQNIKQSSIAGDDQQIVMEVRGRDAVSGLPRMIELSTNETVEAMTPYLHQIIGAVKGVLEETPPELAADIIDKGIVMAGGTSMLRNLDRLMTQMTGVACHIADDPLLCVVKGTGVAIENIELYKRSISRR
jgi:rod shape-determining protein MreB